MANDDQELPWLDLTAAAKATGMGRETIRGRIRRGLLASRKGNDGKLLVQVPAGLKSEAAPDLSAEIADLRADLARAEAERDAALTVAEARVDAVKAEAKAMRELADHYVAEIIELRRPWWRRLIG